MSEFCSPLLLALHFVYVHVATVEENVYLSMLFFVFQEVVPLAPKFVEMEYWT